MNLVILEIYFVGAVFGGISFPGVIFCFRRDQPARVLSGESIFARGPNTRSKGRRPVGKTLIHKVKFVDNPR
jgi:hypothetical protein